VSPHKAQLRIGSIIEFLPLLRHLQSTYTPATLPVHVIVPSLIGYGFSGPPPLDKTYGNADQAMLQDQLMRGLGFDGYVAQGGDIGGFVTFKMGNLGKACNGELGCLLDSYKANNR
jgi:microsomal epoxide hydrolase